MHKGIGIQEGPDGLGYLCHSVFVYYIPLLGNVQKDSLSSIKVETTILDTIKFKSFLTMNTPFKNTALRFNLDIEKLS